MKTIFLHCTSLVFALFLSVLAPSAVAQDFSLLIQNTETNALTLVPGQSDYLLIDLSSLDGFSNNVTLSVSNLPAGVTASFFPNPVKVIPASNGLPSTSVLTLTATASLQAGSFPLNVTGAGGGVTNMTASMVTVQFGLLPTCFGAFTGQVIDLGTGLPLPGASVEASFSAFYLTTSDSNGFFTFTNVALISGNGETPYNIEATLTNYWHSLVINTPAVCDATNTANLQLVRMLYGSVTGNVSVQGGGPLAGSNVVFTGGESISAITDANGNFAATNLTLSYTNAPSSYSLSVDSVGNWEARAFGFVQANSNTVINLTVVPICYNTVMGQVLRADTLQPATNEPLFINGGLSEISTFTDAQGNYVLTNVALGYLNAPLQTFIAVNPTDSYNATSTNLTLTTCGATVVAPTILLTPLPRTNYATIVGHILDAQSSLPITNAIIAGGVAFSDAHGAYIYSNILVGFGTNTSVANFNVTIQAAGYFYTSTNFMITSTVTNVQDIYMLKIGSGFITGIARDSATSLPLTNISIFFSVGGAAVTDSKGFYNSGPLQLSGQNVPTQVAITTQPVGYNELIVSTTITNGVTNVVNLFPVKVCQGATIVGTVVNALTQQPITNATVDVPGFPAKMTDAGGNFILTNITVGNNNSPIMVSINASAPGFNPQSRNVTIFCNATISTEFGAPQTAFTIISGQVTNIITGMPLTNVFIGSEYGEATQTDSNGFYQLTQAPLGANNSSRTWNITAMPTNYPALTLPVTVSSNANATLNFGFGAAPTHLIVTESSTPANVIVGSNILYTIVLTNSAADAANVVLSDLLPPTLTFISAHLTNSGDETFTAPAFTNGVITTITTNFAAAEAITLFIQAAPTVSGNVTNITTVTSTTSDTDATGASRTAEVVNNAIKPASPLADVALFLTAAPNPVVQSNQLTYSFSLTNLGPMDAPAVVLDDTLPANSSFISASNSQGTFTRTGSALHWDLGTIANQAAAHVSFIITPLVTNTISNTATAAIGTNAGGVTDANLANNSSTIVVTVNPPLQVIVVSNVSLVPGAITFDPQTGLFEQTLIFNNLGSNATAAIRIFVPGLPATVTLYNATGSANGVPYLEYDQPVPAGGNQSFLLEYYSSTRRSFVSTNFQVAEVVAATPTNFTGTVIQLDRMPTLNNGQFLIEFFSTPGTTYLIQYSGDMQTWLTSTPPIVATDTRTQWIDAGPPKTISAPGSSGQRFYRILQAISSNRDTHLNSSSTP